MAYQLLLLLERGTSFGGFERLQTHLEQVDYPVNRSHRYGDKHGRIEVVPLEGNVVRAEADYAAEAQYQRMRGERVSLPQAETNFSLGDDELTEVLLSIALSPYEAYLLFPQLNDRYTLMTIGVYEGNLSRDKRHPKDQTLAHRVLEVVNCFRPLYGFTDINGKHVPRADLYEAMSEEWLRGYRKTFRQRPWAVYNQTMIFGKALTEQSGRTHLLSAPAAHVLELSHTISLWGLEGLLGADDITPVYLQYDYDAGRQFIIDYERALADHLGVELEPKPF